MSELTPEARRMLMAARAAAEPTAADRERVFGLVAGVIAATSASTAAASVASAKGSSVVGTGLLMKVSAAVILSFGCGYALHAYTSPRQAPVSVAVAARPVEPSTIADTHDEAEPRATIEAPSVEPSRAAPIATPRAHTGPMKRRGHVTSVTSAAHVADEVASIARAEAALQQQDPHGALRALHQHAERFPQGELREERWGLRVIALCTLEDAAARRESGRFLQRHANSVLAQRVRSACEAP